MKIIKDMRVLNPLAKKFDFKFDKEFKYILTYIDLNTIRELRKLKYDVQYTSGCFYPYLVKKEK